MLGYSFNAIDVEEFKHKIGPIQSSEAMPGTDDALCTATLNMRLSCAKTFSRCR